MAGGVRKRRGRGRELSSGFHRRAGKAGKQAEDGLLWDLPGGLGAKNSPATQETRRFSCWRRKTPHAAGQLRPWATAAEPVLQSRGLQPRAREPPSPSSSARGDPQ